MPQSKRLTRWLIPLATILGGVAVVVAAALLLVSESGRGTEAAVKPGQGRPMVPVAVVMVEAMTLKEIVLGVGSLEASAKVEISPEIPGRIRAITFEEGSFVDEGQVLFELDSDRLRHQRDARRAALRAAEASAENARRIFERREQARQRAVFTEEVIEQAEADLQTALAERDRLEAEVALIERELRETAIVAPFPGVISHREVDLGAHVTIGKALASLYQIEPLELNVWLPERHLGRVQRGQPVAVGVAAYPDREFEGVVIFVGPAVDPSTRQFLVKAIVPNQEQELRPGLFATATVTVGERVERPVVPEEALVATRRGYMVFVVAEGRAVGREVETGLRYEGIVEIVDGLSVGEQVVRQGHLRLSGGEAVRVEDGSEGY